MKVLVVAERLESLDPAVDASLGLAAAAQRLGAAVLFCRAEDLVARQHRVFARARRSGGCVRPEFGPEFEPEFEVASEVDLVLLRLDPPVDARYLHATYLLDLVEAAGTRVINRPSGVRALHEKLIALHVPQWCPPTLVSTDAAEVRRFVGEHGAAVVKPVDGFAGADVWLLRDDDAALALAESATGGGRRQVIAQEYLPEVRAGNKRLFVLDGEIIGAVLRRPADGDFRIGPPCCAARIDAADRAIVAALTPTLLRHGIALAGLDVIDGRLIEVNVTCPGAMHKADVLLGTDLSGAIMRRLLHLEETLPKEMIP